MSLSSSSSRRLTDLAVNGIKERADEERVILSQVRASTPCTPPPPPHSLTHSLTHPLTHSLTQVLLDDINMGYQNMTDMLVHRVNGRPVESLAHLAAVIEFGDGDGGGEFVCLELENNRIIAVNRADARAAAEGILRQYGVPQFASADVVHSLAAAAPRRAASE